jgi:hypothetical protein
MSHAHEAAVAEARQAWRLEFWRRVCEVRKDRLIGLFGMVGLPCPWAKGVPACPDSRDTADSMKGYAQELERIAQEILDAPARPA